MKSSEFNELSGLQLDKLSYKELSKLVSEQSKISNKRLTRIQSTKDAAKDAVKSVEKSGGRFHASGRNKQQLVKEAKRIQRFNRAKTGTVKGAKAVTAQRQKQVTGESAEKAGRESAKQARKEKKKEIQEGRKKRGLDPKKLTKKEKAKIKAAGNKAYKSKVKEIEKKTDEKVKEFEEDRQQKQKKDRGGYYYPEADGKGAGAEGDDVDMSKWMSTTELYEKKDSERVEKIMKKEKGLPTPSPYDMNSDKPDEEFTVASENPFK